MLKTPNRLIQPHSTTDWTHYLIGAGSWELDIVRYVTPPSSLRLYCPMTSNGWNYSFMVCNLSPTLDLKQGRMVTECRDFNYTLPDYYRRGFVIGFKDVSDFLIADVGTSGLVFKQYRVTWWDSYDLTNNPKLAVRVDTWDAGAWVEGAIAYHDRLTGAVNRCGLFAATNFVGPGGNDCNFDDTEIWI